MYDRRISLSKIGIELFSSLNSKRIRVVITDDTFVFKSQRRTFYGFPVFELISLERFCCYRYHVSRFVDFFVNGNIAEYS